jgi:hypothetical protein
MGTTNTFMNLPHCYLRLIRTQAFKQSIIYSSAIKSIIKHDISKLATELSYQQYDQSSLNNVPGVSFNHRDRPSLFCLFRLKSWKFRTLQFQKPDCPVLLNLVQLNRFSHCAPAENWTVHFGKPEHLFFLEN